jgi:hypothetical protein
MKLDGKASRQLTREHTRPKDLVDIMVTIMGKQCAIVGMQWSFSSPVEHANGRSGEGGVQRAQ